MTDDDRRAANLATVRAHHAALDAKDIDTALGNFADDLVFDLPYAPELEPFDRAKFEWLLRRNAESYDSRKVDILELIPGADPDIVVAIYDGDSRWAGGVPYVNHYIVVFRFQDGKITRITEYHNPKKLEETQSAAAALAGD